MPAAAVSRSQQPRLKHQKSTPSTASAPSSTPGSYFAKYGQRTGSDTRSVRSGEGASTRSLPKALSQNIVDEPVAFPTITDGGDDDSMLRRPRIRAVSSPREPYSPTSTSSPPPRFSASSSLTHATGTTYSPPRTPPHERSDSFSSHVSVIAPVSSVDVMDALVDGMNSAFHVKNGRDEFFPHMSAKPSAQPSARKPRSDKKSSAWHDPLYSPPLPQPPPGVTLGGRVVPPPSSRRTRGTEDPKRRRPTAPRRSESDIEGEDSAATQRPGPQENAPPISRIPVYSSLPPRKPSLTRPYPSNSRTASTAPAPRSSSRSASRSSARPTPAQAIAAASRTRPHASHTSNSSRAPKAHSTPQSYARDSSDTHVPSEDESVGLDADDFNADETSQPAVSDPANLAPSSASSSRSASRYSTASSSPHDAVDMPSLPKVAGNVTVVHPRNPPPVPPSPPKAQMVPSITEIIKAHAPEIAASRERERAMQRAETHPVPRPRPNNGRNAATPRSSSGSGYGAVIEGKHGIGRSESDRVGRRSNAIRDSPRAHDYHPSVSLIEDEIGSTRSSMDSVAQEVEYTLALNTPRRGGASTRSNLSSPPTSANTIKGFPSSSSSGVGSSSTRVVMPDTPEERPRRPSTSSLPNKGRAATVAFPASPVVTGGSPRLVGASKDKNKDTAMALASYLRSPRLTKLLTLRRKPHSTALAGLQVSLSDVGKESGRPVVVFLGLGCVRYLTALYDEMATALNLRLICIDRWGLGRTDEPVAGTSRGVLEWAGVVEEVLDMLEIAHVSVLAHSAGAPYAMAFAQRVGRRVQGDVCLLAPWVGEEGAGSYKWLKYVPNALVKTAQVAEWKVQGWKLGKPPTLAYDGIGFDPTAEDVIEEERRPSFAPSSTFSEYDDLADFVGKFDDAGVMCEDVNAQQPRQAKRKISKGFLNLWKGGNSGSSTPRSPQNVQSSPTMAPTPRLKGLKSMGSLKSSYRSGGRVRTISTATTATTGTTATTIASPILPAVPSFNSGLGLDWGELRSTSGPHTAPAGSAGDSLPFSRSDRSIASSTGEKEKDSQAMETSFASALLAASHAESARGLNADFLCILNHDHKPWGFRYMSFPHAVKVWYGDKDEKIGEAGVRWMEKVMRNCDVKIVKGASHSLMTNATVVVEALESIADAWDRDD